MTRHPIRSLERKGAMRLEGEIRGVEADLRDGSACSTAMQSRPRVPRHVPTSQHSGETQVEDP